MPSQRLILRICLLGLTVTLAAAAWLAITVGNEPVSPLRALAAIAAGILSVISLGLAVAPTSALDRVLQFLRIGFSTISATPVYQSVPLGSGLLVVGFGATLTGLGVYLSTPNDEDVGDQGAYLYTARWICDHGGVLALPGLMLSGDYPEANRHPLYIALLAVNPDFPWGRALSCLFGVLTLGLGTWWLTRHQGLFTAGVFVVLLGTNKLFLLSSSRVVCEALLGLLCLGTWLQTVNSQLLTTTPPRLRSAGCLGMLAALIWLTKGTGLPLAAVLGLWWAGRTWRSPRTCITGGLLLAAVFLAVSSLLIIRNLHRFGEPFYNVNTLLLFADQFEQLAVFEAEGTTPRDAAREYYATHSLSDLARRGATGIIWESFILLRSLGPAPGGDVRLLLGGPLFLLSLLGLFARREFYTSVLVWWLVLMIPMFGWYVPIAAGDRFLVPVLPGLLAMSAIGISLLPGLCESWLPRVVTARVLALGLMLWALGSVGLCLLGGPNEFAPG